MRRIALAAALSVLLVCAPSPLRAEPTARGEPELRARRRSALIQRDVGWAIAGLGIAAMAAGATVLVYGLVVRQIVVPEDWNTALGEVRGGAITLGAGTALLIPGAVLAIRGQNLMAVLDGPLRTLGAAPFIAPLRSGALAGVTLRF